MGDKDLTSKLKGRSVNVITMKWGDEKLYNHLGDILFVEPAYIEIDEGIFQGHLAFAGFGEAVYKIEDKDKKILYQNDQVLEAYKRNMVESEEEREEIRSSGKFFLD